MHLIQQNNIKRSSKKHANSTLNSLKFSNSKAMYTNKSKIMENWKGLKLNCHAVEKVQKHKSHLSYSIIQCQGPFKRDSQK